MHIINRYNPSIINLISKLNYSNINKNTEYTLLCVDSSIYQHLSAISTQHKIVFLLTTKNLVKYKEFVFDIKDYQMFCSSYSTLKINFEDYDLYTLQPLKQSQDTFSSLFGD